MPTFAKATAIALLTLAAATSTAPVAFGQEEGVTLDPDSPAAKEYALPTEDARRESGGKPDTRVKPGSRDSELFGEGVEPDASAQTGSGSTGSSTTDDAKKKAAAKRKAAARKKAAEKRADAREKAKEEAAATTPTSTTPNDDAVVVPAATGDDDDDGSGPSATAVVIGGGAIALIAVLLGGFGLRAVRGPRSA